MSERRDDDPEGMDATGMREPLLVSLSQEDFERAIYRGRWKLMAGAIIAAIVAAVIVSVVTGLVVARNVTATVSRDVGRAAVFNCGRTNRAASAGAALRTFLTTDAQFNAQLGQLDVQSARIDRDLSRQVRKLGPVLPPEIAQDYFAQSDVFQRLAEKRAQVAGLWAGPRPKRDGKRPPSLARDVLTVAHVNCDQIIRP